MSELIFSSVPQAGDKQGEPAVPLNFWEVPVEEIPPLLLRVNDVARILNISCNKVYVLIRHRELRSVKVGGLRRISALALREYVDHLGSGDAA